MRRTRAPRTHAERGSALIEMTLTLPLLLLLSISVFEFGRAFQYWQVITNAAREGARIAVLPSTSDSAVIDRVMSYLQAGRLTAPTSATVSIVRNGEISIGTATASASTVTVSYPFEFIALQPVVSLVASGSTVGEPITVSASATMRNE